MSDYTTVDLLIESIDEEAGGPLTSEGVELVRKGWLNGQKAMESQLTTAQAEIEVLRGRVQYLEASIKNAIGWIDGDLRDIIRDVGNQICNYNDLYESADRIEHLLAEALRQQAAESENE